MQTHSTTLYAERVVKGDIPACKFIIAACQRHLDDLERDDIEFIDEDADRAIRFIELLPHVKGEWGAKKQLVKLELWQRFIVGSIFGWQKDGKRRFREAYVEVPRKNGKSVLAAGIGLFCMVADEEYGAEVYSGATTEKQAWEVFRPAKLMAERTPALIDKTGIEVNASKLLRLEDYARFEPLIGNPGDGASPSCAIVDEYHEHDSSDLYDTMRTGMGARSQPIIFVITTAGSNIGGPCYEKRIYVRRVLEKDIDDDRLFGAIYTLDDGDDWLLEENWYKANPNLGVSKYYDALAAEVQQAANDTGSQNSTKTKHFNLWVGAKSGWLNMEHWRACADSSLVFEDFIGSPAFVGVDLATRLDITARVVVFKQWIDGHPHYYAFPEFYIPESALYHSKNRTSYAAWVKDGHLKTLGEDEINYSKVEEELLELSKKVAVKEFPYDPHQATQMRQNLREQGLEMVEMPNYARHTNPPMRELEAAIAAGRFHHPDNRCFNWMAGNVVAVPDKKDNLYPCKENKMSPNKIDGIVALVYAMSRAMFEEIETTPSLMFV
jgi:phage terminase large subunit-like protein